ncbi:Cof-type HAD-IIB family hydrolase [Metabacillus iocasae]|uniref:Cof subfamily protein (Haloacid dehalogenase superfamily) n=1 Tax=Priestia iocasae TaxID=2291674 RepID=A0ABS2QYV8_9BACI|nr:Cof-type HAD-IIB family hydrolase [Metabacillus iocasae]MBM7704127.1 Cof subfamily protein (haloacid dehalogenase superfamily) [Metabacillus iocasae]
MKCIAIDMDGTLVNSEQVVSKENADAIRAAQQAGIEVVIATGRSYEEAKYVLQEAGIDTHIICVNGSEVRNPKGDRLSSISLDTTHIKSVQEIFQHYDLYFEVYTNKGTYSNDYDKALAVVMDIYMSASLKNDYEKLLEGAKERFEKGNVTLVDTYDVLYDDQNISIYKLLAFSFDEEKLEKAKSDLATFEGIAVSSSGKENIEVNDLRAQKGMALAEFVKERNIDLKDTVAIGDNYNDVSMFKKAGKAIAMGNAPDGVKIYSDEVTGTNDEDGVAQAILAVLSKQMA